MNLKNLALFLMLIIFSVDLLAQYVIKPLADVSFVSGTFESHEENGLHFTMPQQPSQAPQQKVLQYKSNPGLSPHYEKILMKVHPGQDGRERVFETTAWPYCFYCHLNLGFSEGNYLGSGVLIGPHHILTCGHNVYDYENKQWVKGIEAFFALNDDQAPFGKVHAVRIYAHLKWYKQGDSDFDIALIVINKSIGLKIGWCGLMYLPNEKTLKKAISITGYPGDKGGKQMWTMKDTIKALSEERLFYDIDTMGGQSGSPIWLMILKNPYIVGIHTLGEGKERSGNSGIRLSLGKLKLIVDHWMTESCQYEMPVDRVVPLLPFEAEKPASTDVITHLKNRASEGDAEAQYQLAWRYRDGKNVVKDVKEAVHWYQKSAVQGHPQAQTSLGWHFHAGSGVSKDLIEAVHWYQKAAQQGDAYAEAQLGEAQCELGLLYCERMDVSKAVEWWQKAAERGNQQAQCALGKCYQIGLGVRKDLVQAERWYQKSAAQGYPAAQGQMGMFCAERSEIVRAVEWWQKAAEQGDPNSQCALGLCYETGQGVSKDLVQAQSWYQKSAAQGNTDAQAQLNQLKK